MILTTEAGKKLGLTTDKSTFVKLDRVEIEGGRVLEKFPCLVETPFQIEGHERHGPGRAGAARHARLHGPGQVSHGDRLHQGQDGLDAARLQSAAAQGSGGKGGQGGLEILGTVYELHGLPHGGQEEPKPVARGFLGIELKEGKDNVSIAAVLGKSPAAAAGLKVGDQIVEINSKVVRSLGRRASLHRRGRRGPAAAIVVRRGGEKLDIRLAGGDGL